MGTKPSGGGYLPINGLNLHHEVYGELGTSKPPLLLIPGAFMRRGVPQGQHPHALLARGAQTLGELFPGILDELVADGAPVWDDGELSRLYISFGGHLMVRSGRAAVDHKANAGLENY